MEDGPARFLRAAAAMPVGRARAILACIVCSTQPLNHSTTQLSAAYYAKRIPVIARFKRAIDRHLNYARFETLRNIETHLGLHRGPIMSAGGVGADIIFDLQRFRDGLFAALRNQSAQALHTAGNEFYQEIGHRPSGSDPWHMPDPVALEFLHERQNLLVDVPDEIYLQIQEEISLGLEAGDSIDEMAKRITAEFDSISSQRAETIASTETAAAYGFARDKAMQSAGVQFKKWLTSHLPNVRPAHYAAERDPHNERCPLDEPFRVGGEELMFPGDSNGSPGNVINCHCVSLATE
jgi:uncharacterized protein with gpF-like domain